MTKKRGEKIRGFEQEAEVWYKNVIELERKFVRLRGRAGEDNEKMELDQGVRIRS